MKTPEELYDDSYYVSRDARTRLAATEVLSCVLKVMGPITSAADFGCGVGTWLSVAKQMGATKIYGFDGPWVEGEKLQIPSSDFSPCILPNIPNHIPVVDLAICLEVAEHITPSEADNLIAVLASSADTILFSAAIPDQPGKGHVNLQPPIYWASKFMALGYYPYDIVRSKIWDNEKIPYWYKQNTILYSKSDFRRDAPELFSRALTSPHHLVHPQLLETQIRALKSALSRQQTLRSALRTLKRSLKFWARSGRPSAG